MTKRQVHVTFVHENVEKLLDKELFGNLTRDEWRTEVVKTIDAHLNALTLDKKKLNKRMEQLEAELRGTKKRVDVLESRKAIAPVRLTANSQGKDAIMAELNTSENNDAED